MVHGLVAGWWISYGPISHSEANPTKILNHNYWNRWQRLQATRTRIYHLFTTDNPQPLEYYCCKYYNSRIHQIEVFCSCLLEKSRKKINEFGTFIYSIILLCVYLF
ncbi:uncharacterized protein LOC142236187 isoform X5 [Haematobia irritans]|uniref:uncharacterized protein LOC142236187 isoform X5 n=1 Tax=Haematobia irritans TaxID=7368 RepID=UPI003F505355